ALEVCQSSPSRSTLDREIAFILGELGEEPEALKLLVDSVEDITGALDFLISRPVRSSLAPCVAVAAFTNSHDLQPHKVQALWEQFISMTVDYPHRIIATLQYERVAELNIETFVGKVRQCRSGVTVDELHGHVPFA
ncbi:unnamed protein product, partial [Symbiodinium sp. KB8]